MWCHAILSPLACGRAAHFLEGNGDGGRGVHSKFVEDLKIGGPSKGLQDQPRGRQKVSVWNVAPCHCLCQSIAFSQLTTQLKIKNRDRALFFRMPFSLPLESGFELGWVGCVTLESGSPISLVLCWVGEPSYSLLSAKQMSFKENSSLYKETVVFLCNFYTELLCHCVNRAIIIIVIIAQKSHYNHCTKCITIPSEFDPQLLQWLDS